MNDEQFTRASKIQTELKKLQREEDVWRTELTAPSKLGYQQGWNNDHPVPFENTIPDDAFSQFRDDQLGRISAKREELMKEFAEL